VLTLDANTSYWLSIVNDTAADIDDNWYWSVVPGGNAYVRPLDSEAWSLRDPTGHLGFQLTDDALATVPEPASLGLFGAGLAGLGALGRRRRKVRQNADA